MNLPIITHAQSSILLHIHWTPIHIAVTIYIHVGFTSHSPKQTDKQRNDIYAKSHKIMCHRLQLITVVAYTVLRASDS